MKEGKMKKESIHSFILLFILMASIVIIFFYSSTKFTGFPIYNPTNLSEECNGNWATIISNWTNTTTQCFNTTSVSNDTTNCGNASALNPIIITTLGNCTLITNITNSTQNQTNVTITSCGDGIVQTLNSNNVTEVCDNGTTNGQACTVTSYGASCTYCSSDCKTLITVAPFCGDGHCDSWESCSNCVLDCSCSGSNTTDSSNSDSSDVTSNEVVTTCTPNWQCGEWQECINSTQIRVCTDLANCGSTEEIPPTTSQSCVVKIKETCSDKIKNQDETGVDCGGSCKACGFLTIVGNTIAGTFGNITNIIILIISLTLLVGGFFGVKFFLNNKKGKIMLSNLLSMIKKKHKSDDLDFSTLD